MSNNSNNNYNLPTIFNKKISKNIIKPITHIDIDTGKNKHFTPAAQEWHNSIYNYNFNYVKSLPIADIGLMRLLKGYFSSMIKKVLPKTKRIPARVRRHYTKKIWVGKGDIKHTNDKAIITFFIHNAEKLFLDRIIPILNVILYSPVKPLKIYKHMNTHKHVKITYSRTLTFKEFWSIIAKHYHYKWFYKKILVQKLDIINYMLYNINVQYDILSKMVKFNLITEREKNKTFLNLLKKIEPILPNPQYDKYKPLYESYYITHLTNYMTQLRTNNDKFRTGYINKLVLLVEKLYNKKVQFNIVKLKKLHLNSDLFTQGVALKLRNANNRLYKVLKSSLYKVKLPRVNRVTEIYHYVNKDDLLVNIIRNDNISSMLNYNTGDPLNTLLKDKLKNFNNNEVNKRYIKKENLLSIFNSLKHLHMRGIKIEAKGRITRRLIAARSVFKVKWKGGLKNVDSSFKGISAILLRGQFKSNVQHTYIGTKNRNGAIGVKGWISSK